MNTFIVLPEKKELDIAKQNKDIELRENKKQDYTSSVCIKPWGFEFLVYESNKVAMWCLTVKKNESTSLHCHFKKDTLLIVLSGCAKIGLINDEVISLSTMESLFIPKKKFHSIGSFSDSTCILEIEIFSNNLNFSDKNDLLRLNDQYHRKSVGYESSVKVVHDNLTAYNYFTLSEYSHVKLHNINLELKKVDTLHASPKNSHIILINGNMLQSNHIIKEGTLLDSSLKYNMLGDALILSIYKHDWKEDSKVIHSFEHLQLVKKDLQKKQKKIILTSGCFDILHVGHLHILKEAKAMGDILIVCLSSDEQIRILKGPTRPINRFQDRLDLFKTIECVDYIYPYEEQFIDTEETLGNIMKVVDPDFWVKGSDYTVSGIQKKHPYLRNIHIVPLVEEKSTTNIIKKIVEVS